MSPLLGASVSLPEPEPGPLFLPQLGNFTELMGNKPWGTTNGAVREIGFIEIG